jgi:ABC-2 type transport system permease protein
MSRKSRVLFLIGAVAWAGFMILLAVLLHTIISSIYKILLNVGQPEAILTFFILFGQLLILILGIYYMIAIFYFARDLESLIPLPLKPHEIVISKYLTIVVNEWLILFPLLVPAFVSYGILSGADLGYWVRLPLIFLGLPLLPLAIASILAILLMRVVNLSKKKDALIIVGSLLLMAIWFIPQFSQSGGSKDISQEQVVQFLQADDGMVKVLSRNFPPAAWATKALSQGFSSNGVLDLILFVITSVFMVFLLVQMGTRFFYRGLIGLQEVQTTKRLLSKSLIRDKTSSGLHPIRTIFLREWRLMNRTPMFLLNGIFTVVLIPVIFILMAKRGEEASQWILKVMSDQSDLIPILAGAALCVVCGTLNGTASSTFSREGKQFWISKVVPVPFYQQVLGKFIHSYLVACLGIALGSIAMVILFKFSLLQMLIVIIISLIATAALTAIGMFIDLSRPLLNWISPQRAIKQNMNVFFSMLINIAIIVGAGFGVGWLLKKNLAPSLILTFVFLAIILLALFSISFLLRKAAQKYNKILT